MMATAPSWWRPIRWTKSSMCSPISCSSTVAASFSTGAWRKWSHATWKCWSIPISSPQPGRSSRSTSGRGLAAASCYTKLPIVSKWRPLARYTRPAFPTYSLPSCATRPASREESADEYTTKYHAGRSPSIAAPSTHGHSGGATGLLGAAARILGEPLDLSRTTRRRRPLPVRLSHQHHSSAARNGGLPADGDFHSHHDVLLHRSAATRTPRSQHPVLEIPAGFRRHDRAREGEHSVPGAPAGLLRHRLCHRVHHAAPQ